MDFNERIAKLKIAIKKQNRKLDEIRLNDDGTEKSSLSNDELREADTEMQVLAELIDQIKIEERLEQHLTEFKGTVDKRVDIAEPIDKPDFASGFRSFGEQMRAVISAGIPGQRTDPRLYQTRAITGMGETIASDGGFLVGTEYSQDIIGSVYDKVGLLAPLCKRYQVATNSNTLKIPGIDETSRADGSRQGGIRSYWAEEGGSLTSSKPKFKQLNFELSKLTCLVYLTDELEMDTTALGNWISDRVKDELSFSIDDAIVNGNGVGRPMGILSSNCTIQVSKEVGQAATTLLYQNILKMWQRGIPATERDGVWLMNRDVKSQLYSMVLTGGTATTPVFLPQGGVSARPYDTLFGRPIVYSEHCATLGTAGDVILAHMPSYILVDKPIKSAYSIHVRFVNDENVLRFTYRVSGQPAYSSAITPYKGASNTISPFVKLQTRS